MTNGPSTGRSRQVALSIGRGCAVPGGKSGLVVSVRGLPLSSWLLPSELNIVTPLSWAKVSARVIAGVGSRERAEVACSRGADAVVAYGEEDLKARLAELTGGQGVDVALDNVGGDVFAALSRAMAWGGRLLPIGFTSGSIPALAAVALGSWAFRKWRDKRRAHPSFPSDAAPRSPASDTRSPS